MNQRGHILQDPSQSILFVTILYAKWVAQVSPVFILQLSGGESFSTDCRFPLLLFFLDELFADASCFRPLFVLPGGDVFDSCGAANVSGSFISKFPKRTESMMWVKLRIESSTVSLFGSDIHSSNQSWKRVSMASKYLLMNSGSTSRVLKMCLYFSDARMRAVRLDAAMLCGPKNISLRP